MRFAPTEDQSAFAEAVRALLTDTCSPDAVAAAWGGEVGRHTGLGDSDGRIAEAWSALVDMGVLGLTVPESNGGLGLGFDDLVGILIECGRSGLPDPLADTVAVVAPALVGIGTQSEGGEGHERVAATASHWLERIAGGATVVSGFGPQPLVAAASSADGLLIFGADPASGNPEATSAQAPGDGQGARSTVTVRLVGPSEAELVAVESVDGSRALSEVRVAEDAGEVLCSGEMGAQITADAFDAAALADAALLVGLARRMLEITVEYVSERKQFGVPVGSFQAVKHHLADAGSAVEFAEPLVRHAAHLCSGGTSAMARSFGTVGDRRVAVSMAKVRAGAAAQEVSEVALQCHGAIGYTVEADLHLFMKRTWALARAHGDADWHRSRVQAHLL